MAIISIIVPVYNVEQYLDKCVDSVVKQTVQDIEIILVDDGSTDSSGALCDAWEKKDSRITVIHKENGGLSDARNAGIRHSSAPYIGLIDSDDYIKPDMFEVLLNNLKKTGADLSMCGYADVYGSNVKNDNNDKSTETWTQEQTIREILLSKKESVHAVTKLYKRELFDHVEYPYGKVSEDAFVIMDILDQIKKAVYTPYAGYYYVHREGSIKTGAYKPRDKNRIEAHSKNLDYITKKWPALTKLAEGRLLDAYLVLGEKMVMNGLEKSHPDYKMVFSYLRKHVFSAYGSPAMNLSKKIRITTILIHPALYKLFIKIVN